MNRIEIEKILVYLREVYPNGAEITRDTVTVWQDLFSEYPFEVAWQAVKNLVRTWEGYTMPPPAVLFRNIDEINPGEDTAIGLWRIAERAIKRGSVFSQSEFEELPDPLRMYFGGVSAIRDLAMISLDQMPNERARFLRQAPDLIRRSKAQAALPDNVRRMLDQKIDQIEGDAE
ncbi:MAG: hypothetical protein J6N19_15295 [Clostridium sp.]|nr:hypothetical protein [Clostridium sp.]